MRVREIGALSSKRIAFIKPSPQERGSSAEGVCVCVERYSEKKSPADTRWHLSIYRTVEASTGLAHALARWGPSAERRKRTWTFTPNQAAIHYLYTLTKEKLIVFSEVSLALLTTL